MGGDFLDRVSFAESEVIGVVSACSGKFLSLRIKWGPESISPLSRLLLEHHWLLACSAHLTDGWRTLQELPARNRRKHCRLKYFVFLRLFPMELHVGEPAGAATSFDLSHVQLVILVDWRQLVPNK